MKLRNHKILPSPCNLGLLCRSFSVSYRSKVHLSLSYPTVCPKSVIFSGIQPSGVPHLGNYLGALKPWKDLQANAPRSAKLIFSIVDLHALTTQPDPRLLRRWKREALAALLAIGLNPERCTIFFQSEIAAHAELMWALSCDASFGYLSRMTQWKSKLALSESVSIGEAGVTSGLRLGLFSYPVLQAADILVHGTTHVPVGQDQKQHLEFARECAQAFNRVYGPALAVPDVIISHAKRVLSFTDPTQKMSKSSGDERSRILLTDDSNAIYTKVRRALTDSEDGITYDPQKRPGVSNLLEIIGHLEHSTPEAVCSRYGNATLKAVKEDAAKTIATHLGPIRDRLVTLLDPAQGSYLDEVMSVGRQRAEESSQKVASRAFELMGLTWRPTKQP